MRVIRFYKPYGVLSQFSGSEGRRTLAEYIPVPGVYAAGRLDLDSEGLLILTDNGALNTRLTDPRHGHKRTYLAQVERIPDEIALQNLREGIVIRDYTTRPAEVELLPTSPDFPE